jgi:hypothetical protein
VQPLRGIVVAAVEQAVAAPICTRHLCDLGARVIKVDNRVGDDFARAAAATSARAGITMRSTGPFPSGAVRAATAEPARSRGYRKPRGCHSPLNPAWFDRRQRHGCPGARGRQPHVTDLSGKELDSALGTVLADRSMITSGTHMARGWHCTAVQRQPRAGR